MSDELDFTEDIPVQLPEEEYISSGPSKGNAPIPGGDVTRLTGMYENWFLDYASYVILERAVPDVYDGLKPVQRRILHSMKRLDDGRYNKVANIIGHTMQFHPHGDASIGDALVQLGQKDLLIDCQGNWGNILTGDGAAAPRYIEARLSKFALDVVFNPKTTDWRPSYDGRNKEPLALPVKFPLLLVQGVEGIAVGLASKILPHNFIEVIDAAIAHLRKESFTLLPDFNTAGMVDCSRYNDGLRGGVVKVRARIKKVDSKTLAITEIPFGKTTVTLIESIIKANDKGKIKIRKIDDNTAENVEILLHLHPGISPDKTIDALYAFTDCEYSISPNNCVIDGDRPSFMATSEILRRSVDNTVSLLRKELEIRLTELGDDWHSASLEKIFIVNEVYEGIKNCRTEEEILKAIDEGLKPFVTNLRRPVVHDDLVRLSNIPIKRISKYSSFKADEYIKGLEEEMKKVQYDLDNLIPYAIAYYEEIKRKHSKGRERKTEIRSFDTIEATKVVIANEKLYVNRTEGFVGTGLKKDEYICDCSDIDEILVVRTDGTYLITKVAEKQFVGKNIEHVAVFRRNDNRTVYNIIYRDGLNGDIMMKRCTISGLNRDKEYTLTKGTEGSKLLYFTANPNGESEVVKVYLKPRPRLKKPIFDLDLGQLAIKGKGSAGNLLTRYAIHKIVHKEKGASSIGGTSIWWDADVRRLNTDQRGQKIGEFQTGDKLLAVTASGLYHCTNFNLENHYEDDTLFVEKFDSEKVFSAVYFDAEQGFYYLKRFCFEATEKLTTFVDDTEGSKLVLLSGEMFPQFEITFGGKHKTREPEKIDAEAFIAVKGFKAKGKRLTTFEVAAIKEIEPLEKELPEAEEPETDDENPAAGDGPHFDGPDTGVQMSLGF